MQVDLVKKVFKSKKDNKNYTFLYLRFDSKLIPIEVKLERDKETDVIKNPSDISVLKTIATKIN